jgi:iron complex outermembrane recepter protein
MKPFRTQKMIIALLAALASAIGLHGQTDSSKVHSLDTLSLKDLLNQKIVSVSKTSEFLFDAPLSASVLTREDIRRAGSTTIMEALRLIPGVIVREQSNGNYEVHLRGMDNVPPNASFDIASTTTLVMIDNRPIYSYLRGGTFWETLPIDLNDVEKIEVVRGPAAALYGPNAVNGVINIITRRLKQEGWSFVTNNQHGSLRTFVNNASLGYRTEKFGVLASGNFQRRDRSQTSYFEFARDRYLDDPDYFVTFNTDTFYNVSQRYPNPSLAMKKYGGNVFLSYTPAEDVDLALSTGAQHSLVQKVAAENEITPLSLARSDTRYVDFRAGVKGFSSQLSYNTGTQVVDHDPGNKFDFNTFDANLEYNFSKDHFSLRPGISYRCAVYDDTEYSDTASKAGIFNTRGEITTVSGTLRGEFKMFDDKLRLIGGVAANKFNYPDETYFSYQAAATYKISSKHIVRAVVSRAPRSSNIFDTYVDQTVAYFPVGYRKYMHLFLASNKNLDLFVASLREIGYRGKISKQISVDIELFYISGKNANLQVTTRPGMEIIDADTVIKVPIVSTNLPLIAMQRGLTLSVNYIAKKFQVKPFVTVQHTHLKNYAPYHNTADAGMGPNHIYSGMGTVTHTRSTPAVFGGASVDYSFNERLMIGINSYFYTSQNYYHLSNVLYADGVRGIDHIRGKVLVNASLSYKPASGLRVFLNAKNILNDQSREFFRADKVPFMLLGGFSYEL